MMMMMMGVSGVFLLLPVFLLGHTIPSMTTYITELQVSYDNAEGRQFKSQGFNKIYVDLNKGAGGKYIYLWYKRGSVPITKVQVSFNDQQDVGMSNAGYTKIHKDLNSGAGGSYLYLWSRKGSGEFDTPIVDITVTADNDAAMFNSGWERVACDLNRGAGGEWIHIWLKREAQTYICDVTATDSFWSDNVLFRTGYIRVDEDTNRGAGGAFVFIWYRQTTNSSKALKDLQVSITDGDRLQYRHHDYTQVFVDLNEDNPGDLEYLWYKKEGTNNPIKAITLILNKDMVADYHGRAGVTVIGKNLNTGNKGRFENLCFYSEGRAESSQHSLKWNA